MYAKQLMQALVHMKRCSVVHADLKPDNILVGRDDDIRSLQVCDFGSAMILDHENIAEPTPYLVSRYYRAPELILGLPFDYNVDLWSCGILLFEVFTGQLLFTGNDNNDMLKQFQETLGPFPNRLLKKHRSIYLEKMELEPHFDEELLFRYNRTDPGIFFSSALSN